jgi:hypothetical protein
MKEQTLAVLLLVAAGLIVAGTARFSTGAALIIAGVLLALWSWLVFGEVEDE